jgi:hypothetical protein
MELNKIEVLLEKYLNAETTLKEEQQLKTFFSQETVPNHLESYKSLFGYFSQIKAEETFTKPLTLNTQKSEWHKWFTAAAVVAVSTGVYFNVYKTNQDLGSFTPNETQLAYNQFVRSLEMVSKNFNKGTSSVNYLQHLSNGASQVAYLNEMQNPIGRIIKLKH